MALQKDVHEIQSLHFRVRLFPSVCLECRNCLSLFLSACLEFRNCFVLLRNACLQSQIWCCGDSQNAETFAEKFQKPSSTHSSDNSETFRS
jgi:hypothetical protein